MPLYRVDAISHGQAAMFARRMAVGRLVAIVQAVGVCGAGVIIVNDIHLRMVWQLASVSAVAIAFVHCAHAYVPVLAMVVMVHGKAQGHRYQRDDGSQYT